MNSLPSVVQNIQGSKSTWDKIRRRFRSREEGSALVEMAVTLPLVMLIMTGIFSFSIALYQKLMLAEAVSNAGRVLASDRGDNDPCKTAAAALTSAAPGLSASGITVTFVLDGTTQPGSGPANSASCPGSSKTANSYMVAGQNAQIQAQYSCSLGVYNTTFSSCQLSSQITEEVQ
ncbi:MAG TPA: TadE/TadG family type IV pilus assembly protein [Terracidiphilus sp.]|jgi:Flp pilus assembly protein TadG|nr:TadE/TadG family type IV pilus assembly protein [Terracidiphilus sp.]